MHIASIAMAKKNTDIECLRAVAIILTVLQHLYILLRWNPHPFGAAENYLQFWGGVDLFFCISGFVVSKSVMDSIDLARTEGRQWFVVKAFWVRRVYRLLPSAWLWAFVMAHFGSLHDVAAPTVAIMASVANFAQYFGINMGGTTVYWSLSLEEQFYLLFPFFVIFVPVAWRYKVLLIAIALQFPMRREMGSIFWLTRLDSMMWGVVIYLFSRTPTYRVFEPQSLKTRTKAWGVSLFFVFLLIAVPGALDVVRFHVGLMAAVSAALVYIASFNRSYVFPSRALRPIMVWIGSRSYAIYLCHLPAYVITHEYWSRAALRTGLTFPNGTYTLRYIVTALALIALFAELNYRLIEVPLRNRGSAAARRIISVPESATA
ncbi:acyltransferase family protein [Paraburkholderia acidiphila]|uniref:Acyltransferase family protein n=1 Tax=Paraburkholderia acidiphila TaxID=2571747 RepID=A0A7Z2J7Q7_9BURK|nr:acyltransferase [Paraburkholderia acidiphila]QGZ54847.1 acyltransferase family protein [Paraburkholderia acidiphila]